LALTAQRRGAEAIRGPRAQAELAAARQAAELAKQIVIEGLTEEKERLQEMLDVASARELQLQTQVRRA
jgi:hypothetical protein